MSEITVVSGWQQILNEALQEAAALPEEWLFEIVAAERVDGALKLSATYVSGDVPLDDHLPPERKLPHPWRSMMRIRENARATSLVTCECAAEWASSSVPVRRCGCGARRTRVSSMRRRGRLRRGRDV